MRVFERVEIFGSRWRWGNHWFSPENFRIPRIAMCAENRFSREIFTNSSWSWDARLLAFRTSWLFLQHHASPRSNVCSPNWFFKGDSSMGVMLENQYKISTNPVVFSLIRQSIKALSIWRRLIPPTPKNLCPKKTKQLCKNSRGLRGSG